LAGVATATGAICLRKFGGQLREASIMHAAVPILEGKGNGKMTMKPQFRHLYPKIPEVAAGFHPFTGKPFMVRLGKKGFTDAPWGFDVIGFNEDLYVTPEIQLRMLRDAGVV
jgi:hypothetical protein